MVRAVGAGGGELGLGAFQVAVEVREVAVRRLGGGSAAVCHVVEVACGGVESVRVGGQGAAGFMSGPDPQQVRVEDGTVAEVTLTYDTGIR